MRLKFRVNKTKLIVTAVILVLAALIALNLDIGQLNQNTQAPAAKKAAAAPPKVAKGLDELPKEAELKSVAQTNILDLRMDAKTGHFMVVDKRNGNKWYSYPDPEQWLNENQSGVWRNNLRSPIMFEYVDMSLSNPKPKESNFIEENGTVKDVQTIDGGFKITFDMPSMDMTVPVEVKIENDSVVTKVIDSGVKEGSLSLVWLRVYPFFGAQQSVGQDGYMFIPDGSGALIRYKKDNKTNLVGTYREPIYGPDVSFKTVDLDNSRRPVIMPVFGAKSDDKAYVSVVEDGAEFAEVIASPSEVLSSYNWITAQQSYRSTYRQVTNEKKDRYFITYNKDARFGSDRAVRYLLLDKGKADYVGMAERYRQYLIDTYGLKKVEPQNNNIPLNVTLVGAVEERGTLVDTYLKQTTTSDAIQIVEKLHGLGVDNMVVNYTGFQKDGYDNYGDLTPVDKRLGGSSGMKQFIEFAHTLDIPVYLEVNYAENNTNDNGFSKRHHGLRDLGGKVIRNLVSLGFVDKIIDRDIETLKELGADGVTLVNLGKNLNSDYNTKYGATRDESRKKQQQLFEKFRDASLDVRGEQPNIYVAPYVKSISRLLDDYSYDLFSDTSIPFVQMALHGLVPYTSEYANQRQQFRINLLHDIEYGANPSFILANGKTEDFKFAQDLHLYNPSYSAWESTIAEEYRKFNEALGDVQDQFISNHRTLAPQVKETTYSGGKRVIVNYNSVPYTDGKITVNPQDYLVIKGGS